MATRAKRSPPRHSHDADETCTETCAARPVVEVARRAPHLLFGFDRREKGPKYRLGQTWLFVMSASFDFLYGIALAHSDAEHRLRLLVDAGFVVDASTVTVQRKTRGKTPTLVTHSVVAREAP